MDNRFLIRLGAGMFAIFALVLVTIEMTREDNTPDEPAITRQGTLPDTLRKDLRRCLDLGETATRDTTCRQLWVKERERFLAPKSSERLTQPSSAGATPDPTTGPGKQPDPAVNPAAPPVEAR